MRRLAPSDDPALLVGSATGDDAAVWRLDDERALVFTADFITPVVDDARTWGRVAATNAVSDVYAMGGRPLLALNLVCWNTEELSSDLLGEVLAGGQDVAVGAGFVVGGGHTVDDPEPKFGMAVVGEVHPDCLLTNAGLRSDQLLVLTKPLGIGVITTALKRGVAGDAVVARAVASMTRLNDVAARVAIESGATGATDVTGFGLLGHAGRMAAESGVDLELWASEVPLIDGALELARDGSVPGGTGRNLAWALERLEVRGVDDLLVTMLADAQTSGGLVFGVDEDSVDSALAALAEAGQPAAVVGVARAGSGEMTVTASQ